MTKPLTVQLAVFGKRPIVGDSTICVIHAIVPKNRFQSPELAPNLPVYTQSFLQYEHNRHFTDSQGHHVL